MNSRMFTSATSGSPHRLPAQRIGAAGRACRVARTHRRLGIALAAASLMCAHLGVSAQTVLAESSFFATNQGWQLGITPNATPAPHVAPIFGAPQGGYIYNPSSSGVDSFTSNASFLGNQSAALGGVLRFSLQEGNNFLSPSGSVALYGNGLVLGYEVNVAAIEWTQVVVPLQPDGWVTLNPSTGITTTTTWQDMSGVLGNLAALQIAAFTLFPDSSVDLDNVALLTPVPEPGAAAMLALGLGVLAWRRRGWAETGR
ncbi:hypothetical protein D621_16225 [beta proteobacterium AAP51]|nr:hypothetical protein D621_16225 [beta proteobacterium AAP51]